MPEGYCGFNRNSPGSYIIQFRETYNRHLPATSTRFVRQYACTKKNTEQKTVKDDISLLYRHLTPQISSRFFRVTTMKKKALLYVFM